MRMAIGIIISIILLPIYAAVAILERITGTIGNALLSKTRKKMRKEWEETK